jgi:NADPH2:quinone reductase
LPDIALEHDEEEIMTSPHKVIVERFGGPEVLTLVEMAVPDAGPGQILVRVEAAGVLYGDIMRRKDRYLLPTPLPYAPGTEIAGIVEAVGSGVSTHKVGDRIFSFIGGGGYAHFAVVDASAAIALPDAIGFGEATALLAQGVTAWLLTHDTADLAGRSVFIESAAGGVGMQIIQLARTRGARFIVGSASSPEKRRFALKAGADLMVDSRSPHWSQEVLAATGGHGIDVGYESSGASFAEVLACLSPFGTLVKFGRGVDEKQSFDPTIMVETNQSLRGFYLPGYRDAGFGSRLANAMASLIELMQRGDLIVHIDHRFALADAALAHRAIEERTTMGKVVIEPWRVRNS